LRCVQIPSSPSPSVANITQESAGTPRKREHVSDPETRKENFSESINSVRRSTIKRPRLDYSIFYNKENGDDPDYVESEDDDTPLHILSNRRGIKVEEDVHTPEVVKEEEVEAALSVFKSEEGEINLNRTVSRPLICLRCLLTSASRVIGVHASESIAFRGNHVYARFAQTRGKRVALVVVSVVRSVE
jgi:hypothetical protein